MTVRINGRDFIVEDFGDQGVVVHYPMCHGKTVAHGYKNRTERITRSAGYFLTCQAGMSLSEVKAQIRFSLENW